MHVGCDEDGVGICVLLILDRVGRNNKREKKVHNVSNGPSEKVWLLKNFFKNLRADVGYKIW